MASSSLKTLPFSKKNNRLLAKKRKIKLIRILPINLWIVLILMLKIFICNPFLFCRLTGREFAVSEESDDLTIDIKRLGAENFKREILFYCKSKSELSYVEAREQFSRKVLETKDYYNGHIRVRVHGKGIIKS